LKIFVSYSRRDAGDFAEQIRRHLKTFNHTVFTDINSINIGDIWNDVIEDNITNCDVFIIIITHGSLVSPHVDKEVLQAQREHKTIIPCVHRNVELRGVGYVNIKWGLEKIQGIEFEDRYELARDLYLKIEQYQKKEIASLSSKDYSNESVERRNILTIIADQSRGNVNASVYDFNIIKESGLPVSEVYNYLYQLESLGMIKLGIKASGADFRLVNITGKGLDELSSL
jgi:hypothetical protein